MPEQPPEWLSLLEKEDFPEQHLSLLSGYKGSPTLAYLEKGLLEKRCRCRNWCQRGSPCLLSLAGLCAPAATGTKHSALLPKSLVLPVPPCPASRHGHRAACPSACLSAWLLVCLSVCLATAAGRVSCSSVLLQPPSGVPSAHSGLPPMPYFVDCLFARLLRLVAAAKIENKSRLCV